MILTDSHFNDHMTTHTESSSAATTLKYFTLDVNGKKQNISIDRLKVAYVDLTQCMNKNSQSCSRIFRSKTYTEKKNRT